MAETTLPPQGMDWLAPLLALTQSLRGQSFGLPAPHVNQAPDWAKFATVGADPAATMPQLPELDFGQYDTGYPTQMGQSPGGLPTQLGQAPQDYGTRLTENLWNPGSPGPMSVAQILAMSGNPLFGIMQGIRAGDTLFRGPAPAEAQSGLPPLSFEQMHRELGGEEEKPKDEGLTVPFDINSMPRPPVYEAPPGVDTEGLQSANRLSILGGLAGGAAQVSPTEAGSFARALAAAGSGGAQAGAQGKRDMVEVAHRNALNAYNVAMKNKELDYEFEGKKFEMTLPQIKATKDAVIVQEYDKDAGAYKTRVIPTEGPLGNAKNLKTTLEAMGLPGPGAEAMSVSFLAKTLGNDPAALSTVLQKQAVERTIESGAASAVFGEDVYKKAQEVAISRVPPALQSDAEAFQAAVQKETAAVLMSEGLPEGWLDKAAQYGVVTANILRSHGQ